MLAAIITFLPSPAQAGFFSYFLELFSGEDSKSATANQELPVAAISLPLLGSQANGHSSEPAGVGGPDEDEFFPLSVSQDSALVASRNPLGTLPGASQDQILVYRVVPGDTPGAIAERFGISLNTLLWANSLPNPHLIKTGDELIILPVSGVKYEVKKGDTIESIAKKFKGDPAEILAFNGLAIGETLGVGSVLIIPDGEIAPPPSIPSTISRAVGLPDLRGYFLRPIWGGRKSRGLHGFNGVDLAESCGAPVLASAGGTVIVARPSGWNGGYGKYLVISHPNGTQTLYAHLSSLLAKIGQQVAQGSQVATTGSTGNSTGCHVHFEVRGAKNPF